MKYTKKKNQICTEKYKRLSCSDWNLKYLEIGKPKNLSFKSLVNFWTDSNFRGMLLHFERTACWRNRRNGPSRTEETRWRKKNANSNEKKVSENIKFSVRQTSRESGNSERIAGEMCTTQSTLSNNCDVDFISFHFIWSGSEGKCENQFISGLVFARVCTLDPLPNQSNKYLYKQICSFRPVNVRAISASFFFSSLLSLLSLSCVSFSLSLFGCGSSAAKNC